MKIVNFYPLDAWIFRKPVYFGIGDIAESDILPSLSVINGALRTAIGQAMNVDWKKYVDGLERSDVYKVIGKPSENPPFTVSFPMLSIEGRLFIKLPFNTIVAEKEGRYEAISIPFDAEVEHINVKLPKLISFDGRESLSGSIYISIDTLEKLVRTGEWMSIQRGEDFVLLPDIATPFWHTGIRIDKNSYTVFNNGKGHMFRYMGVEFKDGVSVAVVIDGNGDVANATELLKGKEIFFGAKGKVASIDVHDVDIPINRHGSRWWFLYSGVEASTPPWSSLFDKTPTGAALQGKYVYTGFDLAKKDGKPSIVMLPVSSTFFFEDGCDSAKQGIFITI